MNFQIASDLHIEKNYPRVPPVTDYITPEAPILILAGDIGRVEHWTQYSSFVISVCQLFDKVILIAGNHEYYTKDRNLTMEKVDRKLKSLEENAPNLKVLQNEVVFFGKRLVIFGSTFWSELPSTAQLPLPIYTKPGVRMTTSYYNMLHYASRVKLEEMILQCTEMNWRLVVVSHHAPTFAHTLAPKHRRQDPKNFLYCSRLDEYLVSKKVKTWIYGHTGHNTDVVLPGNTRLLSNQLEASGKKDFSLNLEVF